MKQATAMYVHVPFCRSICAYCDFTRVGCNHQLIDQWLEHLAQELKERFINPQLKTLYVGGGTPTALNEKQLEHLLELLNPYSQQVDEYTMEINPETMSDEKIAILVKHHINRVSIGLQSTEEKLLQLMNRKHTWSQVQSLIEDLRRVGIENISLDCMIGLPSQTLDEVERTLQKCIQTKVPHLSLYSLTIEENSEFGRKHIQPLPEDQENEMYFKAVELLEAAGYRHYEVSNFALPGYESKHNQVYWHYEDFYGVGLGASGKENQTRYDNTDNFVDYFNHHWVKETISLSEKEEMFEMLMMNLRLKEGMELSRFEETFHQRLQDIFLQPCESLQKKGWIEITKGRIFCTEKGFPILNSVLACFLEALEV